MKTWTIILALLTVFCSCNPYGSPTGSSGDSSSSSTSSADEESFSGSRATIFAVQINGGAEFTNNPSVDITYSVAGKVAAVCFVQGTNTNNCEWTNDVTGTYNMRLTTPATGVGSITVTAIATDGQKLSLTKTAKITLDTIPPAGLLINEPGNAYHASNSITVSFTPATDDIIDFHKVAACKNAACNVGCIESLPSDLAPIGLSGLIEDETYYLCAQAYDKAGNVSGWVSTTGTVTVDTVAPLPPRNIVLTEGNLGTYDNVGYGHTFQYDSGLDINGAKHLLYSCPSTACQDILADECSVVLDHVYPFDNAEPLEDRVVGIPFGARVPENSQVTFCFAAVDAAGNESQRVAYNHSTTFDYTAPTAPSFGSAPWVSTFQDHTNNPDVLFRWDRSLDTTAGVDTYEYMICTSSACDHTDAVSCPFGIKSLAHLDSTTTFTGTEGFSLTDSLDESVGERYFACSRAVDKAGNASNWSASTGIGLALDSVVPTFSYSYDSSFFDTTTMAPNDATSGSSMDFSITNYPIDTASVCLTHQNDISTCTGKWQSVTSFPLTLTYHYTFQENDGLETIYGFIQDDYGGTGSALTSAMSIYVDTAAPVASGLSVGHSGNPELTPHDVNSMSVTSITETIGHTIYMAMCHNSSDCASIDDIANFGSSSCVAPSDGFGTDVGIRNSLVSSYPLTRSFSGGSTPYETYHYCLLVVDDFGNRYQETLANHSFKLVQSPTIVPVSLDNRLISSSSGPLIVGTPYSLSVRGGLPAKGDMKSVTCKISSYQLPTLYAASSADTQGEVDCNDWIISSHATYGEATGDAVAEVFPSPTPSLNNRDYVDANFSWTPLDYQIGTYKIDFTFTTNDGGAADQTSTVSHYVTVFPDRQDATKQAYVALDAQFSEVEATTGNVPITMQVNYEGTWASLLGDGPLGSFFEFQDGGPIWWNVQSKTSSHNFGGQQISATNQRKISSLDFSVDNGTEKAHVRLTPAEMGNPDISPSGEMSFSTWVKWPSTTTSSGVLFRHGDRFAGNGYSLTTSYRDGNKVKWTVGERAYGTEVLHYGADMYWKLDESSGTTGNDSSGRLSCQGAAATLEAAGSVANLLGSASPVLDPSLYSRSMTSSGYLYYDNGSCFNFNADNWVVMGYFYPQTISTTHSLFENYETLSTVNTGFKLDVLSDGSLQATVGTDTGDLVVTSAASALVTTSWQHVALRLESKSGNVTVSIYVNGQQVATGTQTTAVFQPNGVNERLRIAGGNTDSTPGVESNDSPLSSQVAHVAFFSSFLNLDESQNDATAAAIADLADGEFGCMTPDLLPDQWYHLAGTWTSSSAYSPTAEAGDVVMYLDGQKICQKNLGNQSNVLQVAGKNLYLGAHQPEGLSQADSTSDFDGSLGNVHLYQGYLSSSEVAQLHQAEARRFRDNPWERPAAYDNLQLDLWASAPDGGVRPGDGCNTTTWTDAHLNGRVFNQVTRSGSCSSAGFQVVSNVHQYKGTGITHPHYFVNDDSFAHTDNNFSVEIFIGQVDGSTFESSNEFILASKADVNNVADSRWTVLLERTSADPDYRTKVRYYHGGGGSSDMTGTIVENVGWSYRHIVLTYDNGTLKLYEDAADPTTTTQVINNTGNNIPFYLLGDNPQTDQSSKVPLIYVRYYNSTLTVQDITRNYCLAMDGVGQSPSNCQK